MSMRRYLLKLAIFSLPLMVFFYSFSWWIGQQPSELLAKKQLFDKKITSTDLLILGRNDAYHGIDARTLSEHSFSLATPGQSFILDAKLAQKYVPQLKKLNSVIFTISPAAYSSKIDKQAGSLKAFLYRRYFGVSEQELSGSGIGLNILGFFRNENAVRIVVDGLTRQIKKQLMDEWGSSVSDDSTDSASPLPSAKFSAMDWKEIEDVLKSLRKKKINVFFVSLPTPEKQPDQILRITYKLSEKYDIPYFNYANDSRMTKSDFTKDGFLNHTAKFNFSRILQQDIAAEIARRTPKTSETSQKAPLNIWNPDLHYFPGSNQTQQS